MALYVYSVSANYYIYTALLLLLLHIYILLLNCNFFCRSHNTSWNMHNSMMLDVYHHYWCRFRILANKNCSFRIEVDRNNGKNERENWQINSSQPHTHIQKLTNQIQRFVSQSHKNKQRALTNFKNEKKSHTFDELPHIQCNAVLIL